MVFFFVRGQLHVWGDRNIVQAQPRLRVLHGVSCCHGDHPSRHSSLKSVAKLILLYILRANSTPADPLSGVICVPAHQRDDRAALLTAHII